MLRSAFIVAVPLLFAGYAQAQGAACDPETFDNQCAGTTLTFCPAEGDNPNTENTFDCTFPDEGGTPGAPGGSCEPLTCADVSGDACADLDDTCLGSANDPCLGSGFLLDGDATNDAAAFAGSCTAGNACVTAVDAAGTISETCTADAFVCETPFSVGCNGDQLVLCLGISEDANANGALDAGEDTDEDGQLDEAVITAPFIMQCDGFFAGCDDAAADGPLHAAGLYGEAAPAAPDCALPAEGEGEGEGGEGEGEGEGGEDECEDDSDCGDGQTCEDGECVAPPPACGNAGASTGVSFAVLGLVTVLARRRRRA